MSEEIGMVILATVGLVTGIGGACWLAMGRDGKRKKARR